MVRGKIILLFGVPVLLSFFMHLHMMNMDVVGFHSWRQTQTQTVIWHFVHSDNNIFHPQRFDLREGNGLYYEFPLYQWLIAQADILFGYSVACTRIITFLFFVLFLAGAYKLFRHFAGEAISLMTVAFACFSPLLYYYSVNPLPDTLALACSVWALHFFFSFLHLQHIRHFVLFSAFVALAALCKLPYVLFSAVLIPWFFGALRKKEKLILPLTVFLLFLLLPTAWYIKAIPTWGGNPVSKGMMDNKHDLLTLLDYLGFTLVSSLPELLTNYAACIPFFTGIFLFFRKRAYAGVHAKYFIAVVGVLALYYLFEMNLIEKTHDYYLMPFIIPIFVLVLFSLKHQQAKWFKNVLLILLIAAPVLAWFRIDHRWDPNSPGYCAELLSKQKELQALIPQGEKCIVDEDPSRFITLYFLQRQGISLDKNEISEDLLRRYQAQGFNYLLTENLSLDLNAFGQFRFTELYSGQLKLFKIERK